MQIAVTLWIGQHFAVTVPVEREVILQKGCISVYNIALKGERRNIRDIWGISICRRAELAVRVYFNCAEVFLELARQGMMASGAVRR